MRVRLHRWLVAVACLTFTVGCGSSSDESPRRDGAPDTPPTDTPASIPDGPKASEIHTAPDALPKDLPSASDGQPDAALVLDGTGAPVDGRAEDVAVAYDLRTTELVTFGPDGDSAKLDSGAAVTDGPADVAADGFTPAPATPVVVNSGNTATYNLADGTWKVFYFDATKDQLYCIAGLSGIVHGYVSSSATVSPTSYQYATDLTNGTMAFTASATQRYYVAAAVSGGGASGSFQVADGGQLLAVGANTVTLSAPDMDNTSVFRFPISKGRAYSVSVAGPSTTSVSLVLSPLAERASGSQFLTSLRGVSGPLPFADEAIPSTSVDLSYSGFYYFSLRVYTNMTVTVTITQTS